MLNEEGCYKAATKDLGLEGITILEGTKCVLLPYKVNSLLTDSIGGTWGTLDIFFDRLNLQISLMHKMFVPIGVWFARLKFKLLTKYHTLKEQVKVFER